MLRYILRIKFFADRQKCQSIAGLIEKWKNDYNLLEKNRDRCMENIWRRNLQIPLKETMFHIDVSSQFQNIFLPSALSIFKTMTNPRNPPKLHPTLPSNITSKCDRLHRRSSARRVLSAISSTRIVQLFDKRYQTTSAGKSRTNRRRYRPTRKARTGADWPVTYREATGYVKSYNATEASWVFRCVGLFFAHRLAVLLCRPLLVLVSVRFIRESAPVCEGVIFFTLSEQPPLRPPLCPSLLARVTDREPLRPLPPKWLHESVAFVCVASMGIDILFPIVRAPSLFLFLQSASHPPLSVRPSCFDQFIRSRSSFFLFFFFWSALRVFFNYNSFSYPINHQYFHCPSVFSFGVALRARWNDARRGCDERRAIGGFPSFDERCEGGFVGWLFQLARFPWPPSRASIVLEPAVRVRSWYNDGVANDDSLMRLNINSHFVDASPLSRPIFFSLSRPADLSASFSLTYTFQPLFLSVDLVVSSLFHPFPPFAFCMRCGRVRRRTNTADDVYPSPLTHLIDG